MTDQQRIARWLGWTPHGDDYWLIPAELDTSPEPGLQSGEPRRLPDLGTFAGCAEWCALIKGELERRGLGYELGWNTNVHWSGIVSMSEVYGATELAALTAAVLALMEDES